MLSFQFGVFIHPWLWMVSLTANFIVDSLAFYNLLLLKNKKSEKHLQTIYLQNLDILIFGRHYRSCFLFTLALKPLSFQRNYCLIKCQSPMQTDFLLIVSLAILIAGIMIYRLNLKRSFAKTELSVQEKHLSCLRLAIFTAPYIFLLPLQWII